ncbi:hypothetical protein LCGC14_2156890 [marine sediment metagenome]|uniref:Uncharacterized protein n=1 Tax=marine sediment metagenome TaxID=412755 RepID=A0A0F9DU41_9ZZZZ
MSKSFATLINEIQSDLGDDTTTYTDAKVTIQLEKAIKAVSDYKPYVIMLSYFLETRTGTATTDTANALVDSQAQFLSTDVDKVIYNTDDNTWAVVTAFVDAGELTLSKDIFPDGDEAYAIFNKGCRNKFQINIEDVTDFIHPPEHGVTRGYVFYKGKNRNFTIEGDILTIDKNTVDDSADSDADVEVYVWFKKKHRVSQLADLAGAIDAASYAAGTTTINVDELGSTVIVAEDTLLTIAGIRGTYRVTEEDTTSGNEIELKIWPGLDSAATLDDVVTIIGSTLTTGLERLVVELTAARTSLSRLLTPIPLATTDISTGRDLINLINKGGTDVPTKYINSAMGELSVSRRYQEAAERRVDAVLGKLERLKRSRKPVSMHIWPKD